MKSVTVEAAGPLERLTEAEIGQLLRGFSPEAVSSALALRTDFSTSNLDACLFGILSFYLPSGVEMQDAEPSEDTRLREDLGLDSLSMAESMFKLEELFDIHLENGELAEVFTISDARRLVMEKLEAPSFGGSNE